MMLRISRASCLALLLLSGACTSSPEHPAQPTTPPLGRSNPEAQGIDSRRLIALLQQIAERPLGVHSLLIARRGQIVLDADFFPYDGVRPHDFASCTKSLTSTAIGLALSDGRIASLDDSLLEHLPEYTPRHDGPDKREISIAHALSMTTGLDCVVEPGEPTLREMQAAPDWVGFALDVPMAAAPGTSWRYCSSASHILSAIVSVSTGQSVAAFLGERLFDPIGAREPEWPRDPQGHSHGWGDARLRAEDMARVGQLFLQQGRVGDRQLLDAAFIADATTNRVDALGPSNGYGYGWWMTSGRAYFADGRGGQLLLIVPRLDAVIVTTGSASPEQALRLRALLNQVPSDLADGALPENPAALRELQSQVEAAKRPPAPQLVPAAPERAAAISGRDYRLGPNPFGWDILRVTFAEHEARLELELGPSRTRASIGLDAVPRITRAAQFSTQPRHSRVDVAMSGSWVEPDTFEIAFDTIDTIDAGTLRLAFADSGLKVTIQERTYLGDELSFDGRRIGP